MNPLRDYILSELVKPEVAAHNNTYIGVITEVSQGTATVIVGDPGAEMAYENVPIAGVSKGVYGQSIDNGSLVIISFMQDDQSYPYIVSLFNNEEADYQDDNSTGKIQETLDIVQTEMPVRTPNSGRVIIPLKVSIS